MRNAKTSTLIIPPNRPENQDLAISYRGAYFRHHDYPLQITHPANEKSKPCADTRLILSNEFEYLRKAAKNPLFQILISALKFLVTDFPWPGRFIEKAVRICFMY